MLRSSSPRLLNHVDLRCAIFNKDTFSFAASLFLASGRAIYKYIRCRFRAVIAPLMIARPAAPLLFCRWFLATRSASTSTAFLPALERDQLRLSGCLVVEAWPVIRRLRSHLLRGLAFEATRANVCRVLALFANNAVAVLRSGSAAVYAIRVRRVPTSVLRGQMHAVRCFSSCIKWLCDDSNGMLLFFLNDFLRTSLALSRTHHHRTSLSLSLFCYLKALLTLLISNNFAEIKSSVFKKFDKHNLFQLSCHDVVERFKLALFLAMIMLLNVCQGGLDDPVSQARSF